MLLLETSWEVSVIYPKMKLQKNKARTWHTEGGQQCHVGNKIWESTKGNSSPILCCQNRRIHDSSKNDRNL